MGCTESDLKSTGVIWRNKVVERSVLAVILKEAPVKLEVLYANEDKKEGLQAVILCAESCASTRFV